jgi:conjugative relaxase-like TrwC/TraI family protein
MLSIRAMAHGDGYLNYLEKESPGQWVGTGAKILKLDGEVSKDDFHSVRKGLHPETQEKLRIRNVVDRIYNKPWGQEIYKARELYDLTISAPKSVSIMSMFDERISEAHQYAADRVWRGMEHQCGAMVIASFQHHYSRELDPQEHTHLVAGNLAFDGEKWRTLHANNWYRSQQQITEYYRENLLGTLERQGYRIDYPELAEVPQELIERFSQRAESRDSSIAAYVEHFGEEPSNREVAVMVRENREPKQYLPAEEIRERQLARLEPAEREQLVTVKERAYEQGEKIHLPRLHDSVESEEALAHRPWRYAERAKERQRLGV